MSRRVSWTLVYLVTFGPFAVWRALEADWWTVALVMVIVSGRMWTVWRPG